VRIVSEDTLNLNREEIFATPRAANAFRAALREEVARWLGQQTLVILDATQEIKGFRYEIDCLASSIPTPHTTVWCDVPLSEARRRNAECARLSPSLHDDVASRFERPLDTFKWDSPLFQLQPGATPPFSLIVESLFSDQRFVPPPCIPPQTHTVFDPLRALDEATLAIVVDLATAQAAGGALPGERIFCSGTDCGFLLPRLIPTAELHELRRRFLDDVRPLIAAGDEALAARIPGAFVQFLSSLFPS
jgi:protein KTI12